MDQNNPVALEWNTEIPYIWAIKDIQKILISEQVDPIYPITATHT